MVSEWEKGGLDMIDLKHLQHSFQLEKLISLYKSKNNETWTWIPSKYFSHLGINLAFLNSSVGIKEFKGLDTLYPSVWKEHLKVWISNNTIHSIKNRTLDQCIWNNTFIRYQNNVIYFSEWAKKGITIISDIIQNYSILPLSDIENIVGRSPSLHLQYQVVHGAISNFLRQHPIDKNDNTQYQIYFNNQCITSARAIQTLLCEKHYSVPCSTTFWLNKFNILVDKEHWLLAKEATAESRLKELHFKILHNIYPTNIFLFKIKITNSNKCSYCPNTVDFLEHFFYECPKINRIWDNVKQKYNDKFAENINLNVIDILLGVTKKNDLSKVKKTYINHLILIAKMSIGIFRYSSPINIQLIFEKECTLRKL